MPPWWLRWLLPSMCLGAQCGVWGVWIWMPVMPGLLVKWSFHTQKPQHTVWIRYIRCTLVYLYIVSNICIYIYIYFFFPLRYILYWSPSFTFTMSSHLETRVRLQFEEIASSSLFESAQRRRDFSVVDFGDSTNLKGWTLFFERQWKPTPIIPNPQTFWDCEDWTRSPFRSLRVAQKETEKHISQPLAQEVHDEEAAAEASKEEGGGWPFR